MKTIKGKKVKEEILEMLFDSFEKVPLEILIKIEDILDHKILVDEAELCSRLKFCTPLSKVGKFIEEILNNV